MGVDEEYDVSEKIRLVIILVGLALNVAIMWDYISERPETKIALARVKNWWTRTVTAPEKRARALRLAEAETVFEAMTIVEGGPK